MRLGDSETFSGARIEPRVILSGIKTTIEIIETSVDEVANRSLQTVAVGRQTGDHVPGTMRLLGQHRTGAEEGMFQVCGYPTSAGTQPLDHNQQLAEVDGAELEIESGMLLRQGLFVAVTV
jgi:hypothetical protein